MANLIQSINTIYSLFLALSLIFFLYQFSMNLISATTFIKVFGFSIAFILILIISHKTSKKYFKTAIEGMELDERMATPVLMFVFLGGFSIALAIIFISFLESLGILFTVASTVSLILNVLAMVGFFWLAFILFMGWDFIKIVGMVSQYSLVREKRSKFFRSMKLLFRKVNSVRDAFLAFTAIDLACRDLSKGSRSYYKNILFPVKVWTACLTLYENKNVGDALEESFSYFKSKAFKPFYTSNLASFFLPMIIIPVGLSLGIIISNMEYFSNTMCLSSNCLFMIIFFLIFMALGFFFSYSVSISLESAYYVKVLSDIKSETVPEGLGRGDDKIKFIEAESARRISRLKGNIWDVFRIYF